VKITATSLPDVLVIEPAVFRDDRGFFLETFNEAEYARHGLRLSFRQDNRSHSTRGVLRGLHYQLVAPQGKLVMVTRGEIFDVAVDIRVGSPTFGRWTSVVLTGDVPRMLWIPQGFAHGFCVLSDSADVLYKCTDLYEPADDRGVLWCDPQIGIEWPIETPLVSERDARQAPLRGRTDLPAYAG
jgi:dTDP-4-dehydrorhamnose 3,5-epimerase